MIKFLLIACVLFSGCATIPTTPGTNAIDQILTDGTLDTIPVKQKEKIKTALVKARADIVREESQRIKAEKAEKKNATWSGVGKGLAGAGVVLIIAFVVVLIRKIL